jgi:hypothetical protein
VERAVVNGAYLRARTVLSVVTSHYDGIDLPAIDQGFAGAQSNALEEEEVVLAMKSLAHLVSPEVVLQASDE